MTGPIDTIREALPGFGTIRSEQTLAALAALTEVEQQLAAPCRCDKCRDCVAADGYEAAERRANELQAKGEKWELAWRDEHRRANDLADALREILALPGPERHKKAHNIARAALDRHTHQDEAVT